MSKISLIGKRYQSERTTSERLIIDQRGLKLKRGKEYMDWTILAKG